MLRCSQTKSWTHDGILVSVRFLYVDVPVQIPTQSEEARFNREIAILAETFSEWRGSLTQDGRKIQSCLAKRFVASLSQGSSAGVELVVSAEIRYWVRESSSRGEPQKKKVVQLYYSGFFTQGRYLPECVWNMLWWRTSSTVLCLRYRHTTFVIYLQFRSRPMSQRGRFLTEHFCRLFVANAVFFAYFDLGHDATGMLDIHFRTPITIWVVHKNASFWGLLLYLACCGYPWYSVFW